MTTSLVLGGGAARGLAHIGVCQWLEEKKIDIHEVVGTSMGAIVGACFALGITTKKMLAETENVSLLKLLDPTLTGGPLKGKKIWQFMDDLFKGATFDDTIIPLKIVSVNIDSGELYVFREGKIADAIRASVSIPGIIVPYEIKDASYVDGGVIANLGLYCATGDRAIAVSVIEPFSDTLRQTRHIRKRDVPRTALSYNIAVLKRTMNIMIAHNEQSSIAQFTKPLCVLRPAIDDVGYTDFGKYDIAAVGGYNEAQKKLSTWL